MTLLDSTPAPQTLHRCLFHDEETDVVIERNFGIDHQFFERVVDVRRNGNGPAENFFDSYSYHYLLTHRGAPVGTMTLTWLADGEIDCQAYYPQRLLDRFHDQIISGTKLRINRSECSTVKTLRQFIGCVWQDHINRGARLNVMNAETRMAAFYRRMGFEVVENSEFIHPVLKTQSVALVLAVDPDHRSFFQPIFQTSAAPLSQQEVLATCQPMYLAENSYHDDAVILSDDTGASAVVLEGAQ